MKKTTAKSGKWQKRTLSTKILTHFLDNLFTGGEGDLDGAVDNRVEELLDGALHGRSHQGDQQGVGLQERMLSTQQQIAKLLVVVALPCMLEFSRWLESSPQAPNYPPPLFFKVVISSCTTITVLKQSDHSGLVS